MRIIASTLDKGGTGKTTLAVNLAAPLARRDCNVLLVDLDPQGNCSRYLGLDPAPSIFEFYCQDVPLAQLVKPTGRPGLHILQSNSYTKAAATYADRQGIPLDLLVLEIQRLDTVYDFVVIDTHPGGYFAEVAHYMADLILLPVALDSFSMFAIQDTIDVAQKVAAREGKAPPPLWIVPNFFNRTNEANYNYGLLVEEFGEIVTAPIPERVAVRESLSKGPLIESAPTNDATHAYSALVDRLMMTDVEILFGVSG